MHVQPAPGAVTAPPRKGLKKQRRILLPENSSLCVCEAKAEECLKPFCAGGKTQMIPGLIFFSASD